MFFDRVQGIKNQIIQVVIGFESVTLITKISVSVTFWGHHLKDLKGNIALFFQWVLFYLDNKKKLAHNYLKRNRSDYHNFSKSN